MRFEAAKDSAERQMKSGAELRDFVDDPRFQALSNYYPDGVIVVNRRRLIISINDAAEGINAIKRSDWIDRPFWDFAIAGNGIFSFSSIQEAMDTETTVNTMEDSGQGREVLLSLIPIHGNNGDAAFFLVLQTSLDRINWLKKKASGDGSYLLFDQGELDSDDEDEIILNEDTKLIVAQGGKAMSLGMRVLLTGESGVGKTVIAHYLHENGVGEKKPFIHVNCGSIPETLFESEMFGYERGAFTGALQRGKKGFAEAANGGTLFLDEVGEIPLSSQAKLLKFLEDGKVQRIGSTEYKKVRVRLLAATNRDLVDMVDQKTFRKDLYYRLNVFALKVPSLRDCPDMIPRFLDRFTAQLGKRRNQSLSFDEESLKVLLNYDYPGNIRELHNVVEHMAVVSGSVAKVSELPDWIRPGTASKITPKSNGKGDPKSSVLDGFKDINEELELKRPLKEVVREFEEAFVAVAIVHYGSKRKTADALGVNIATIVRKSREVLCDDA